VDDPSSWGAAAGAMTGGGVMIIALIVGAAVAVLAVLAVLGLTSFSLVHLLRRRRRRGESDEGGIDDLF
jgi:hypothetical protein